MKCIYPIFFALFAASTSFAGKAYNISVVPEVGEELLLKDGDVISGTIDGTKRKVRILVANNAKIMLSNAEVLGVNEGQFRSAGISCLGNCTLDLRGKNIMKGYYESYPGVQVPEDKDGQKYTMTIEGDGSLEASSNGYGTGIGCNRYTNCGHLVIKGGKIKAVGGYTSAGIGSCKDDAIGNIVIEAGEITAAGGQYAAGIGGGGYSAESKCGDITISGGKIIAMGGDGAAGIGRADEGSCGKVTITKDVAKVIAIKGKNAPYSIGGSDGFVGTVTVDDVEGSIEENPFMRPAKAAEIVTPGSKTIGIIDGDYSGNEAVNFAKDMVVDTIIFKRTFPVVVGGNNYSTIMFPFEIKAEEIENLDQVYMFLGIGVDKSNNKYVAVDFVWYSNWLSVSYTMEAYKPYLIKLKSNATNIVIKKTTDLVLKATPTEDGDFDVMQSDDYNQYGNYVFRGVVQGKTWDANSPEVLGTNKAAAYGFAGTATSDISVGQFVKVGEGAFIKPFRGYIYKSPVQSVNVNNGSSLRPIASIDDDLPEVMNIVVVDGKKEGEEHTTVIGQFNSRTGEIRLNRTTHTYDLKGRSVRDAGRMAKGVYLNK
ncbi:hypothetical protein SAMN05720465_2198 [Fibrobacter sp. UWB10]|nr:hypothetical protein SAMN05720465_2198 [Fibrobacter sp. UWB10]